MMHCKAFLFATVYGALRPVYLFFAACVLYFLLVPASVSLAVDQAYLDVLLTSARERRLSEDRYWDVLLHYRQHGPGRKSLIDDPRFFLAPDGQVNPSAELEATLRGFFEDQKKDEQHPRCRFIARYTWLKETLAIDESRLPAAACTAFDEAFARINPHSAALIFPTTLNNSPGSMFGHTLIRIDSENQNELLSYASTYAADATDANGLLYAFKGVFGYYHGYYSILSYYDKVGEYSNIEHRDIWEYRLNLTKDEVRKMVMHLWEVRDIYSDYYFFDENCSFDLLLLLEAARPSLHVSDRFWDDKVKFWVIPVDTIRAIRESGLITREVYRPSQATRILAIASRTKKEDWPLAVAVADGKTPPQAVVEMNMAPKEKARVLDLGTELLQYRYARKEMGKAAYLKQFLPTLTARSSLGKQDDTYAVTPPPSPEQGHFPARYSLGGGVRAQSSFAEMEWRPAYHDLLDQDEGFTEGAQINFFDLKGRYYFAKDSLKLQQLHFIDIVSLSPRNAFFKPISWKVNTGFDRELFSDGEERLVYRLNPGGGLAYKSELLGFSYVMLEADLQASDALKDKYALGLGASAGIWKQVAGPWKVAMSARSFSYEAGDKHRSTKASLEQNFKVTTNNNMTFSLSREKTFNQYQSVVKLMWNVYR